MSLLICGLAGSMWSYQICEFPSLHLHRYEIKFIAILSACFRNISRYKAKHKTGDTYFFQFFVPI